ncbi:MAG: type III secretion system chaperone family protein [Henriciella sp.]
MKTIATLATALALTGFASAQNAQSDDLLTSVTLEDLKNLVKAEGHTYNQDLPNGVGIGAEDEDGLNYVVRGAACSDGTNCLGVEFMIMYFGAHDAEFANNINQRFSAIKATVNDGNLILSRYLILDAGQTRENLSVNLRNALAIAGQVQSGEDFSPSTNATPDAPSNEQPASSAIDFGDDSGEYANDAACDDGRFTDEGDDWSYQRAHVKRDATDCRTLYEAGEITLYIDFGDNSGAYADDDTCDDNRFTGEGRSILQTDSHVGRDAADCVAAYQAGTIDRP